VAGEPICPITRTRANARFAWVIGGRRYLFCCPPCIDEFVQQAKAAPASLRPPEAYVQR
jgi:YHS domain-containing protein